MNTNWLSGLYILFDDVNNEHSRQFFKTDKSNSLIGIYRSEVGSVRTLYARAQTGNGLVLPPTPLAVYAQGIQKDFHPAPITGTDNFVAAWASNHSEGVYRIYLRSYTFHTKMGIGAPYPEMQLSGSNGHYVCPRTQYNDETQLIFVCWISVTERQLQGIWLDKTTLEPVSYPFNITSSIHSTFFDTNGNAETDARGAERIVVMKHGDGVIVGIQETLSKINFYRVGRPAVGVAPVTLMTAYSQASMSRYAAVFDPLSSHIMLIYNGPSSYIYGDRIRVFSKGGTWQAEPGKTKGGSVMAPTRLNNSSRTMRYPNIIALPVKDEEASFLASWCGQQVPDPVFYNKFDDYFNQMGVEKVVNFGAICAPAEMVASDNQVALLFNADRIEGVALRSYGVLLHVAPNV